MIRPGGWLLLAFHTSLRRSPEPARSCTPTQWWGEQVDLDFYYLEPDGVVDAVAAAGFTVMARTDREPWPGGEHESRRTYLLCRRD